MLWHSLMNDKIFIVLIKKKKTRSQLMKYELSVLF